MALQINYIDQYGTTHSTAYARVIGLSLNQQQQIGWVFIGVFKDATASGGGKEPVGEYAYKFTANTSTTFASLFGTAATEPINKNPRANAYTEIKKGTAGGYPEWEGAIDV